MRERSRFRWRVMRTPRCCNCFLRAPCPDLAAAGGICDIVSNSPLTVSGGQARVNNLAHQRACRPRRPGAPVCKLKSSLSFSARPQRWAVFRRTDTRAMPCARCSGALLKSGDSRGPGSAPLPRRCGVVCASGIIRITCYNPFQDLLDGAPELSLPRGLRGPGVCRVAPTAGQDADLGRRMCKEVASRCAFVKQGGDRE
jgi:hypothetical protein